MNQLFTKPQLILFFKPQITNIPLMDELFIMIYKPLPHVTLRIGRIIITKVNKIYSKVSSI